MRARTDPTAESSDPLPLIGAVEGSLRRLGTDYLDLYQVHRPSPDTDVEETLGALSGLVHQGKVRCIGSSSYSGSQIVEAQWVGICRKPVVPACVAFRALPRCEEPGARSEERGATCVSHSGCGEAVLHVVG